MKVIIGSRMAIVVGLITASIFVLAVEAISAILHPFPPGVDPTDMAACKAHVARYPAGVLVLVVLAWGLTVFVSSWLATRLGTNRHAVHGLIVGAILLAGVIFNMSMLPYPTWFWINLIVFPVACFCGIKLAQRNRNGSLSASGAPAD